MLRGRSRLQVGRSLQGFRSFENSSFFARLRRCFGAFHVADLDVTFDAPIFFCFLRSQGARERHGRTFLLEGELVEFGFGDRFIVGDVTCIDVDDVTSVCDDIRKGVAHSRDVWSFLHSNDRGFADIAN